MKTLLRALLPLVILLNTFQEGFTADFQRRQKPISSVEEPQERNFFEKQLSLTEALLKYEKARTELQELEARESQNVPQFQRLEENEPQEPLPRFESKRRMNEVFQHPRLQSPNRQSVDYDDSSEPSLYQPRDTNQHQPTLTLGGYQRPYVEPIRRALPASNTEDVRTLQPNEIIPHVIYNDQPLMRIPGMGYEPPVTSPPSRPYVQSQYNPNNFAYVSGFSRPSDNTNRERIPHYAYSNQQGTIPTRQQNPERNYYAVNNPFGYPYTSTNPLVSTPFQPVVYPKQDRELPLLQERGNVLSNPSNFFGGPSAPRQVNPYTVPFSNYQEAFPIQQPRLYPFNPYPRDDRRSEVAESESVSQEQRPTSSSNYTRPSSRQLYLPPRLPNPFYTDFRQQSVLPESATTSDNDKNSTFLMNEYLKYLRSPLPSPFLPDFYPNALRDNNDDSGIDYSKQSNGSAQGRSISQSSPFEFFNLQRPSTRTKIDPNVTPKCAKETNATICFDDEEYPMSDVLFKLDSESLMLRRLLPRFPFEGTIEGNAIQSDATESSENAICQVNIKFGQPKRALDNDGKWKIIVNVGNNQRFGGFEQNVRTETCSKPESPCAHTDAKYKTQCVQKNSQQRFLTWDHERGLHMSLIKLPVACVCQIVNG